MNELLHGRPFSLFVVVFLFLSVRIQRGTSGLWLVRRHLLLLGKNKKTYYHRTTSSSVKMADKMFAQRALLQTNSTHSTVVRLPPPSSCRPLPLFGKSIDQVGALRKGWKSDQARWRILLPPLLPLQLQHHKDRLWRQISRGGWGSTNKPRMDELNSDHWKVRIN